MEGRSQFPCSAENARLDAAILAYDFCVAQLSFDPRWVTLPPGVDGGYAGFRDLGFENKGAIWIASEIETHEHG
ncbi:hypothetical protein [Bradyrhizobium sp. Cp5.3]|uniref:hypothetical protein n=1 Tax=Bradyrhizobium sp. Cp5.3 TaxID=443598 RepID=UPI000480A782|nr:hypothetical protein [Bradyrhizobium sp. Cp5.3]